MDISLNSECERGSGRGRMADNGYMTTIPTDGSTTATAA